MNDPLHVVATARHTLTQHRPPAPGRLPTGRARQPTAGRALARALLAKALWLVALSVPQAACSKLLSWDPNGLPCDQTVRNAQSYFCNSGYSCEYGITRQCLRDHSVRNGQLCAQSRQCATDSVCAFDLLGGGGVRGKYNVRSCLPSCGTTSSAEAYYAPDSCSGDHLCAPFLDTSNDANAIKQLIGGCVPSAGCKDGTSCRLDSGSTGVCVQISATATACLAGCEVTWTGTSYADNCAGSFSCQPIGLAQHQNFVCMYNAQGRVNNLVVQTTVGGACAPVSAPCTKGNVCEPTTNTCAAYCQLSGTGTSTCAGGKPCCPFVGVPTGAASTGTGFCSSTTTCPAG